jgi:diacylglycerol kinase (ATP)
MQTQKEKPLNALRADSRQQTVAVVINPSKFSDTSEAKAAVTLVARNSGWNDPLWFETSKEDSGTAAAQAALDAGVDLVCAMGGDGTVRAVAGVLRGTTVPFGLLPSGTGNLLARNLGIPLGSLIDETEIALLGQDRAIDVGTASFDGGAERIFLVMGGVGLDAEIMDKTDDELKKKVGWAAYVAAGAPAMLKGGFDATLTVDGARQKKFHCLMLLACNCSSVVANIELATGAVLDDGDLELVVLRRWVGAALDVATRNRSALASLKQWPGKRFQFDLPEPVLAELDGDPIGRVTNGDFGVDPGALIVRIPVPTPKSRGLTDHDSRAGSFDSAEIEPAGVASDD